MAEYVVIDKEQLESDLTAIAESIRGKNGKKSSEEKYTIVDMSKKVYQLPSLLIIQHPEIEYNEEKAAEIVAVAQSYLDAIDDGRLVIVYEAGYSALSSNQKIKNDEGVYCINCSAFVGLVLRGISYENSPYFDGDGSKIHARTDLFTWANPFYERNDFVGANQQAFYSYQTGGILRSNAVSDIKKGDVLFYSNNSKNFNGIWHVALAMEDGGTKCVHALHGKSIGIWTYDMTAPPSNLGTLVYIARPQYDVDFSKMNSQIELKILEHPTDQSGADNETAVFRVKAQGEGLTYAWQYSADSGKKWNASNFEGFDTDTQPVVIRTYRSGQMYRCVVTDKYGNSVTSNAATLTCTS